MTRLTAMSRPNWSFVIAVGADGTAKTDTYANHGAPQPLAQDEGDHCRDVRKDVECRFSRRCVSR